MAFLVRFLSFFFKYIEFSEEVKGHYRVDVDHNGQQEHG